VSGGILIGNAGVYDACSRLLLGSLFDGIAADVVAVVPDGARVLEVGCGPGRLSIRLARRHGLDVTGLDLDPAMVERARANADRLGNGDERRPSFWWATSPRWPSPMDRSNWSSAPSRCTIGPTRWRGSPRSAVCCARGPGAHLGLPPSVRPHPFGPRHAHLPDPVEHTRHPCAGPGGLPSAADRAGPCRWATRAFGRIGLLTRRSELWPARH
jgi:hypothetical protein